MSQQYQASPFHGQQPPMFHPQYMTNTQSPGALPNYQQNFSQPNIPLPQANGRRFEHSAMHAPTPPPIPFPLNFDPAFLKQLTGNSNMQFPLPPPPPPPHILSSQSFARSPYPQFQSPIHAQNGVHSQLNARSYIFNGQSPNTHAPYPMGTSAPYVNPSMNQQSASNTISTQDVAPTTSYVQGDVQDVSTASHAATPLVGTQYQLPQRVLNAAVSNVRNGASDIRSDAKSAISQLCSHGISFQDLLSEGVANETLRTLFKELGLTVPESVSPEPVLDTTRSAQSVVESAVPLTVTMPGSRTSTPKLGPEDAGLERKDRIARLLAARKAQASGTGKSSQSASPAPQGLAATAMGDTMQATTTGREASGLQPMIAEEQQESTNLSNNVADSPPVSHALLTQAGLAIPGLSMISVEQNVDDVRTEDRADNTVESLRTSRKRSAEEFEADNSSSHSSRTVPSATSETLQQTSATESAHAPRSQMANKDNVEERMAQLKAKLLRRNSRKKALQDGMPALDAEVERIRAQLQEREIMLADVRVRIEALSTSLVEARAQENKILAEIEEFNGQIMQGEHGQARFENELSQIDRQERNEIPRGLQPSHVQSAVQLPSPESDHESRLQPKTAAIPEFEIVNHIETQTSLPPVVLPAEEVGQNVRNSVHGHDSPAASFDKPIDMENSTDQEIQREVANMDELVEAEVTAQNTDDNPQNVDITQDEGDQMSIDDSSVSVSDGSASMSDSSIENHLDIDTSMQEDSSPSGNTSVHAERAQSPDILVTRASRDPEQGDAAAPRQQPNSNTTSLPGLDDASSDIFVDTTATTPHSENVPQVSSPAAMEMSLPVPQSNGRPAAIVVNDGLEIAAELQMVDAQDVRTGYRFTPYQSPLAGYKSYRFHPDFKQKIKDGYRSLTYSNSIDPNRPLCPIELGGVDCNVVGCEEQHFRSLNLSDDKILMQLSSSTDITDKQQRDTFLLGLKQVIASLREQGVKEFSDVAAALSQYRRNWLTSQPKL